MAQLLLEHKTENIDKIDLQEDIKPGKIIKHEAFLMLIADKTNKEVYEHFGVTKQALSQWLDRNGKKLKAFKAFVSDKANSLELIQFRFAEVLTDKKLRSLTASKVVGSMEKLEKMVRLQRDQSTGNLTVTHAFDLSAFK